MTCHNDAMRSAFGRHLVSGRGRDPSLTFMMTTVGTRIMDNLKHLTEEQQVLHVAFEIAGDSRAPSGIAEATHRLGARLPGLSPEALASCYRRAPALA